MAGCWGVDSDDPYAVDSYNKEGTRIVKRELFARKGGKLLQTWTASGNFIEISRDDPEPNISHDEFYLTPFDFQTREGDDLLKYDATFKKPVTLEWNYDANPADPTRDSTSYHWWAAYDVPSDSWSYRRGDRTEGSTSGIPDRGPVHRDGPTGRRTRRLDRRLRGPDLYWNTV